MSSYKKIYFMGIKGVGMATLAVLAQEAGFVVCGSDVEERFITDKILKNAEINVLKGFLKENVTNFLGSTPSRECLFIATGAHNGFDNEEALEAVRLNIKVISQGEAVGLFMSGKPFERVDMEGISVAGSHGKTTVSAMIAFTLSKLGYDPSYTVGTSEIFQLGAAGHYGRGRFYVAEADEYLAEGTHDRTPKFLYQSPKFLIINNIDFDHPDFYKDKGEVAKAYERFVLEKLTGDGLLIVNGDDEEIKKIISKNALSAITYGTDEASEFVIKDYKQEGLESSFKVARKGTELGQFRLSVPGYHNAKNSLAVIALLMEIGAGVEDIKQALQGFLGTKRRFERVGEMENGIPVFDDYAHHPEEIRKTLEAVASAYPTKKIVTVFQAHTFARTQALTGEFVSSFAGVSELIILPTFASARDSIKEDLDRDREFVEKIRMVVPNTKLIENIPSVVEYIKLNVSSPQAIIVTMGAGDVYKIAEKLSI